MEHVLMLGNGFDLYYKLPTKYSNFLQITDHICRHEKSLTSASTVADILNHYIQAHKNDIFITNCLEVHNPKNKKHFYTRAIIDSSKLKELAALTRDNIWFKYFLKSFNKDVGWIDFEKEIAEVIHMLHQFLVNLKLDGSSFEMPSSNTSAHHIIKDFGIFYTSGTSDPSDGKRTVLDAYKTEHPVGSGVYCINTSKIFEDLWDQLIDLATALRLYLSIFVESIIKLKYHRVHFTQNIPFGKVDRVITFNYTNTYERLYGNPTPVIHLHGDIDKKIVLGINPDEYDEDGHVDTMCIAFKKYYQRVICGTYDDYLKWIKQDGLSYTLTVMGHSLDVTDSDIIKDLFTRAEAITIMYNSSSRLAGYIENIVKIYGKSGFEKLLTDKNLTFKRILRSFVPEKQKPRNN